MSSFIDVVDELSACRQRVHTMQLAADAMVRLDSRTGNALARTLDDLDEHLSTVRTAVETMANADDGKPAAQAAPTGTPAAEPDPMLDLVTRVEALREARNRLPDDEADAFHDATITPLDGVFTENPPQVISTAGAAAAIRHILFHQGMDECDEVPLRQVLAFLERKAKPVTKAVEDRRDTEALTRMEEPICRLDLLGRLQAYLAEDMLSQVGARLSQEQQELLLFVAYETEKAIKALKAQCFQRDGEARR